MKICTKCKQQKTRDNFPTRSSSLDGLDSWCKDCVRLYAKRKRTIKNDVNVEYKTCNSCRQEKHKSEFGRVSSSKDGLRGACKSCRNLKARMRYEKDSDFRLSESIRHAKIYQENREAIITRTNKWSSENKDKKVEQAQRRRARQIGQLVFELPDNYVSLLSKQQGYSCAYCGCDISTKPTTDHLLPLSRGGKHSVDNIKIACCSCNSSKHNKTLCEWLEWNKAAMNYSPSERLKEICQNLEVLISLYPDRSRVETQ